MYIHYYILQHLNKYLKRFRLISIIDLPWKNDKAVEPALKIINKNIYLLLFFSKCFDLLVSIPKIKVQ